jgi:uncharacterized protein Yka (UPF0111/DUF47 family)
VIFRRRFGDLVARQLDAFEEDHADLLDACEEALRAYREADREEAQEVYERFGDLQEEANETLRDIRDTYAATVDGEVADRYAAEFDRAAARRYRGIWLG